MRCTDQLRTAFPDVYWWNQGQREVKAQRGGPSDPVRWEARALTSFPARAVSLDKSYHRVLCSSLLCCAVLSPHTILHHTTLCWTIRHPHPLLLCSTGLCCVIPHCSTHNTAHYTVPNLTPPHAGTLHSIIRNHHAVSYHITLYDDTLYIVLHYSILQ